MSYRICYKCEKVRSNVILEYLSICLWCKIAKFLKALLKTARKQETIKKVAKAIKNAEKEFDYCDKCEKKIRKEEREIILKELEGEIEKKMAKYYGDETKSNDFYEGFEKAVDDLKIKLKQLTK